VLPFQESQEPFSVNRWQVLALRSFANIAQVLSCDPLDASVKGGVGEGGGLFGGGGSGRFWGRPSPQYDGRSVLLAQEVKRLSPRALPRKDVDCFGKRQFSSVPCRSGEYPLSPSANGVPSTSKVILLNHDVDPLPPFVFLGSYTRCSFLSEKGRKVSRLTDGNSLFFRNIAIFRRPFSIPTVPRKSLFSRKLKNTVFSFDFCVAREAAPPSVSFDGDVRGVARDLLSIRWPVNDPLSPTFFPGDLHQLPPRRQRRLEHHPPPQLVSVSRAKSAPFPPLRRKCASLGSFPDSVNHQVRAFPPST